MIGRSDVGSKLGLLQYPVSLRVLLAPSFCFLRIAGGPQCSTAHLARTESALLSGGRTWRRVGTDRNGSATQRKVKPYLTLPYLSALVVPLIERAHTSDCRPHPQITQPDNCHHLGGQLSPNVANSMERHDAMDVSPGSVSISRTPCATNAPLPSSGHLRCSAAATSVLAPASASVYMRLKCGMKSHGPGPACSTLARSCAASSSAERSQAKKTAW